MTIRLRVMASSNAEASKKANCVPEADWCEESHKICVENITEIALPVVSNMVHSQITLDGKKQILLSWW